MKRHFETMTDDNGHNHDMWPGDTCDDWWGNTYRMRSDGRLELVELDSAFGDADVLAVAV